MKTRMLLAMMLMSIELMSQQTSPRLVAIRAHDAIRIDGVLDESDWHNATFASPFLNKWPQDSGKATAATDVKMLYDDNFIYIAAVNHQSEAELVIPTLKRDQIKTYWNSDAFAVVLDPIRQKINGYFFAVNAGGAQTEGAVGMSGSMAVLNENWDNKWYSEVKIYDDRWIVEMAIPFTSLRFEDGGQEWGLNFVRNDMKRFMFSTWSHVPLQFDGLDLGYLGTLAFDAPVSPRTSKIALMPFLAAGHSRNHEDGEAAASTLNVGMDAKVALNSSLNIDLTLHPDFSNVEVDRQMTNVTRYSLLFPERRNFFLENSDLFAGFGSWMVKPFFSRRIGLSDGEPIPVMAGARLSGNITKGLRIGMMDVQTESTDEFSAQNYFVTALQQSVMARSSVKMLFTNRQTTRTVEADTEVDYNRTAGGEFVYMSPKGGFNAAARAHVSMTPERFDEQQYLSAQAGFLRTNWYGGLLVEKVGQNYINSVGFIPKLYNYDALRDTTVRIGHYAFNHWFGLMLYPKKSKRITMIEPNTWGVTNFRTNGDFLERFTSMNVTVYFKNTAKLFADATNNTVKLPFASDLLDNDNPIPVDTYRFTQYSIRYTTDARKIFNAELGLSGGNFYCGWRTEYGVTLNARVQPWGSFGVSYLQNDIHLPEQYGTARFYLVGPSAEISITNKMWWSTFVQYNTQADNFNVNSRFQWRFRPMSDLFVVYSDHYTSNDFAVKHRGLVVKLTYWLNM